MRQKTRVKRAFEPPYILQQLSTFPQRLDAATLRRVLLAVLAALLMSTLPLEPVDVALDPGHSRADTGSSASSLREYQLTFDLAQRVQQRLEAAGLKVRLTRLDDHPLSNYTNPNSTPQIQAEQEARIAAAGTTSIYVSLHFNGGPVSLRGTETYVNPDRAPDVSADFALAEALQTHVLAALADEVGYASLDRGVKSDLSAGKSYGHFFGLRGPYPSALIENLFLSNAYEAALLRDEATLDALADGCAQGVLGYFSMGASSAAAD
jgi:N-acetylmuramoyl-L-alanine amidase